jgi:hypothetical protein
MDTTKETSDVDREKYRLEHKELEVATVSIAYYNGEVIKRLMDRAKLQEKSIFPCSCCKKTQSYIRKEEIKLE